MLGALARAAERAGAASLHLQTDTDNTTALALYERHGFERHHAYVNLSRPPRLPRLHEARLVGRRRRGLQLPQGVTATSAGATACGRGALASARVSTSWAASWAVCSSRPT